LTKLIEIDLDAVKMNQHAKYLGRLVMVALYNRATIIFSSCFMVALWNRETIYIFMLWFVYGRPM